MKKAKLNLLYGDEEIELMLERGISRSSISIAWNTLIVPNHENTSISAKSSIIFVGRLQPSKNIDTILNVFESIIPQIPRNVILEIVGSDTSDNKGYFLYLKKLANKLQIENRVLFHGEITDADKLKIIFKRSLIYVSPSPVGLGALHSFSYGVPVLTVKNVYHGPEYFNLIHNVNSLIALDLEEFKNLLIKECNLPNSDLGKNAYEWYVKKRHYTHMCNAFIDSIESI